MNSYPSQLSGSNPAGEPGASPSTELEAIVAAQAQRISELEAALAIQTQRASECEVSNDPSMALVLLDAVYAHAPVGLAFVDTELRYVRANQMLAEMGGLPVEAYPGRTITELIPQLGSTIEPLHRQVLTTGEPIRDIAIHGTTPADPTRPRTWLASYYPVPAPDGTIAGVGIVVRETTALMQAEHELRARTTLLEQATDTVEQSIAALRASEERFRAIIENSQDATVLTDREGRIHYISPGITRILGYTPEELVGQSFAMLIDPIDRPAILAAVAEQLQRPGAQLQMNVRACHRDGSRRWIQGRRSNQLDNPAIGYVVASVHDVTEQVHAQEAMAAALQAERQARQILEATQARLQALGERLVAVQEEERRHLARELHDEIGQTLTGLSLILSISGSLPPEMLHARLHTAQAQVGALIAQVRRRSLDLRPAMLDDLGLRAALDWYLERYQEQTGVVVRHRFQGLEQRFSAQVALTAYRIVQEALTNVARYAGVAEASVQLWVVNERLVIQVEDAGRGFDVANARTAYASNGLAGMRERAVLLGGDLTIESEPGAGTRLLADLPISQARARDEDS